MPADSRRADHPPYRWFFDAGRRIDKESCRPQFAGGWLQLSQSADVNGYVCVIPMIENRKRCRHSATTMPSSWRCAAVDNSAFGFLEHRGLETMPLQQLVELRAIAFGKLGCLRHVAAGDLEESSQIIAFERFAGFLERHERRRVLLERLLDQRRRDDR